MLTNGSDASCGTAVPDRATSGAQGWRSGQRPIAGVMCRTAIVELPMLFIPEASGPSDPVPASVDRRPGSVRRTSTIDTARPDGFRGDLVMTARARDLRTASDGTPVVMEQVDLSLRVDGLNRQVLSIGSSPALPGLDQLVGYPVGPGFRSRIGEACPGRARRRHLAPPVVGRPPGCRPGLGLLGAAGRGAGTASAEDGGRREHLGPGPDDGVPG